MLTATPRNTGQAGRLVHSGTPAENKINGPHRNVASASGEGLATELLRRR